jgi:hypothetical protein
MRQRQAAQQRRLEEDGRAGRQQTRIARPQRQRRHSIDAGILAARHQPPRSRIEPRFLDGGQKSGREDRRGAAVRTVHDEIDWLRSAQGSTPVALATL